MQILYEVILYCPKSCLGSLRSSYRGHKIDSECIMDEKPVNQDMFAHNHFLRMEISRKVSL